MFVCALKKCEVAFQLVFDYQDDNGEEVVEINLTNFELSEKSVNVEVVEEMTGTMLKVG